MTTMRETPRYTSKLVLMVPDRDIRETSSILRTVGAPENQEVEKRRPHPQIGGNKVPTATFDESVFIAMRVRRELESVLEGQHGLRKSAGEPLQDFTMLELPADGEQALAYSTVMRGYKMQDPKTGAFLRRDTAIFNQVRVGYTLDEGMFKKVYVLKEEGKYLASFLVEPIWKLDGRFSTYEDHLKTRNTFLLNGNLPVRDYDFVIPQSVGKDVGVSENCTLHLLQLDPTMEAVPA